MNWQIGENNLKRSMYWQEDMPTSGQSFDALILMAFEALMIDDSA